MGARGRRPAAAAAAALCLAVGGGAASGSQTPSGSPAELPVAGTVSFYPYDDDTSDLVRGAVHAVRRVPGATAVYYSLGVPDGVPWSPNALMAVNRLSDDYRATDAAALIVVDPEGLRVYEPMIAEDGCLCPASSALGEDSGVLNVGWALLPELPAGVDTVTVQLASANPVEDVPVGEGALLPAVAQPSTVLGTGWPALPDAAAIASVGDPDRFVRSLVRNTADLEGRVSTQERPGQVAESLSADVLFAVDSAELSPQARGTLDQLAARVRERSIGEVTVTGHTDSSGAPDYNLQLSTARAQAVLDALRAGVDPATALTAVGRGEQEPLADNGTEQGRAQNRRVTVTYQVEGG